MNVSKSRVNQMLSLQDVQDIEFALDLLESKLEFLPTLTETEKAHKVRLGVNNWNFVRTAKDAYDEIPALLPRIVEIDDYENDLALLFKMRPYESRLAQILVLINDSSMLLGDLAFKDSLAIFRSAQEAAKRGMPGAQLWLDRLETRFAGQSNRPDNQDGSSESDDNGGADGGATGGSDDAPTNSGTPNDGPVGNSGANNGGSGGTGGTNGSGEAGGTSGSGEAGGSTSTPNAG